MDRTNAVTIEEMAYSLYYGLKVLTGGHYTDQDFHHVMDSIRAYEKAYLQQYTDKILKQYTESDNNDQG